MVESSEKNWVEEIGRPAYESIAEMVAALNCDYDRLAELRDERDGYQPEPEEAPTWEQECPNDAEELAELEEAAKPCGNECANQDDARQMIEEDALSVRIFGEKVDGEWEADRFEVLLSTGGPAVRIVGDLDEHGEPTRARLEVQDWFKPWTEYFQTEQDTLLAYCRCFYFGE